MKLRELLQRARQSLSRGRAPDHAVAPIFRPRCYRPALEILEQRCLLSTLGDSLNVLLTNPGTGLQAAVNADIYNVTMPILGAGLSTASQYADTQFLQGLGTTLQNLLTSPPADYTAVQVASAINGLSDPPGMAVGLPTPPIGGWEVQVTVSQPVTPLASGETFAFSSGLFLDSSPSSSVPAPLVLTGAPKPVNVSLGYNFVFDFGQDASGNVYLDASNTTLQVTVKADLNHFVGTGTLMGVPVKVADGSMAGSIGLQPPKGNQPGSVFQGAFTLQINGGSGSVNAAAIQNNQTNLATSSPVTFQPDQATYGGNAYINLGIVVSPIGGNFPGIGGNLQIVWPLTPPPTANTVQNLQLPSGDSTGKPGTTPTVAFNDLEITDIENIFNQLIEPILQPIQQFLAPIAPILNFLNTPIPILDELDPGIKPIDILTTLAGVPDTITPFLKVVLAIANGTAPALPMSVQDELVSINNALDFGSFNLPASADLRVGSLAQEISGFVPSTNTPQGVVSNALSLAGDLNQSLASFFDGAGTLGIPLFGSGGSNPATLLLDTLLGQNEPLFTYTLPQFDLAPIPIDIPGFSDPGFPIYPPFPLFLSVLPTLGATASLSFGYDTQGLEDGNPLDGLFFYNPPGGPQTGITVTGNINFDGSVNVGLLAAGIGGGFTATLGMLLDSEPTDPASGTQYFENLPGFGDVVTLANIEALASSHSILGLFAPSAPQGVTLPPGELGVLGGTIGLNLNVFLQVGVPPIGFDLNKNFGDLTLFDFNFDPWTQEPHPPVLAAYVDPTSNGNSVESSTTTTPPDSTVPIATPNDPNNTTLRLNFGNFAGDSNAPPQAAGTDESFTIAPVFAADGVTPIHNAVLVTAYGITQEYDDVTRIQAWGAVNPSGKLAEEITVEPGVTANVDFFGASRATPLPNQPLTNTFRYEGSGIAKMHGGNWATNYLYGGTGTNFLYGSAVGNDGNGLPPGQELVVDNYLFGGTGVGAPAQNYLYGYDPALAAAGQQGSSVEMIGGGSDSFNQMTSAGADVFSQAGVTVEVPTTSYLLAGAGSNTMIGGSGFNYYEWTEGDGSLTVTGGVPGATLLIDGQPLTDTNQLEILGGGLGSEHWSVEPAQTTTLQILGTDLIDGQTVAEPPIAASGIQVLALDTAVGALATGLGSGTERANPGNNTFMVGDLSETGIQQVILNAHESQGSPDLAPDTIIIDGSQIPDSADKVAIADENFQDGNSQELELEDVSLTTILGASGGAHLFGFPQPAPYNVAAAITNPLDSLTVNTYQGDDQVNVLSTTGPGSTHVNTGAGSGPGGNNQIVVGSGPGDILPDFLDDIQGELFIDAGNGTGNSLLISDSATTNPDTLVLTNDSLVRYAPLSNVSREGDFPAHKRYPFVISYTATGGAYGAGIELDATMGSDTIYVPSTPRRTSVTIDTGTSDGAAVSNPPPGPNPPHDQVFVGFDGANPNGPPNPESLSTLDGILSPVNIVGEGVAYSLASQTDITIADEAAQAPVDYTLDATEFTSKYSAPIDFNQSPSGVLLTNLVLMAGANAHIDVLGTSAAATTTVDAGPGNNAILVTDAGSLAPLRGLLVVNGGPGNNVLTVDDSADTAAQAFNLGVTTGASGTVTGGTVTASYSVPAMTRGGIALRYPIGIDYAAISTLNVLAGSGGIGFVVQSTPGLTAVNLSAVGTGNSLSGPNANVTWQFAQAGNSFSQGSLFGTVSFSGILAIQGGTGNDDFLFLPGGFASSIDGGAGTDTLDFSQFGNVSGQGVELAQDGTLDGVQGVANFGLPEFNDVDALVGSPGSFLTGAGNSGAFYSGSFNQTLSVSGFASMQLAIQGNFNGKLLAATEGTAGDPIASISVGGLMGSAGLIKVGFLQSFTVGGSMFGTLKGFGVDPSTPTIQSITIAGNFLSPGQIIAATVGQLLFQHDFGGVYDETSPTGDFQSLEIDGNFLASGLIEAGSGGMMTVFGDFIGKAIIAGALNSIVVDGIMNGVLSAGSIGSRFLSGLVTGHIYTGLNTAPPVNIAPGDTEGLIQAIDEANEINLPSLINLAAGSTYILTAPDNYWYGPNGLPAIASNITINGNGAIIERVGSTPFRIFEVSGGNDGLAKGTLTLNNLTVEGGLAQGGNGGSGGGGGGAGLGGAIFNQGTLFLIGVTLTENEAHGGAGDDSAVPVYSGGGGGGLGGNGGSGDTALDSVTGGGGGGGMDTAGQAGTGETIPADFTDAYSGQGGYGTENTQGGLGIAGGGPVSNGGSGAFGGGGGGGFEGGNGGDGGDGGGGGGGSVGDGGLNDNNGFAGVGGAGGFGGGGGGGFGGGAGGFGGGGGGSGGAAGFGAAPGGGHNPSNTAGVGGSGAGLGGAIFNLFGSVTITNSTLAANTAQGGSTPSSSNAQAGSGLGGALFNLDGVTVLTNDTLAGNHVVGGSSDGAGSGSADADDLYNLALGALTATVTLTNDILAGTTPAKTGGASDAVNNGASASITAVGPSLIQQVASGTVTGSGQVLTGDPLLGPLQNNGGPTPTMEVLAGSPVLTTPGLAPNGSNGVPVTDQRGVNRGTTTDIGAYQATTATQLVISGFPTLVTASIPENFTVTAEDTFGKAVYTYAGTVSISSTDPKATLPAPAALTAGVGPFTAALNTPGVQALIASDGVINVPGASQPQAFVAVMPGFGTQTQLKILTKNPVYGQPVQIQVHVQGTTTGAGTPMGTVVVMDGTMQLLMSALDASGNATVTTPNLPTGANALTATYMPGGMYTGSTARAMVTVGMASTQTALTASPSPAVLGQTVTLMAMVSAKAPGAGMPTGRVQFKDGSTVIGTAMLDSNGMAMMQTAKLTVGKHSLTASYGGDGNFVSSTGTASETVGAGYSLVVTNAADPDTLVSGTLRAAIFQANSDAARGVFDTITFNTVKMGTSTIVLSQGVLELSGVGTKMETIDAGKTPITIDGNNATEIFLVDAGVHELLNNLTITNGMSNRAPGLAGGGIGAGGGIDNNGLLTMTGCILSHDRSYNDGGAIYSNSQHSVLTMTNCSLANDTAGNDGGAIDNGNSVTLTSCSLSNDSAGAAGGAIENHATLTVTASTFTGCYAVDGAAIDNRGTTTTVTNSTFANNGRSSLGAVSDQGGALWNIGTMILTYDTISANSAHTGGGVYTYPGSGSLTAMDTIVAANSAPSSPDIAGALQNPSHNLLGTALEGIAAGAGDVFSDQPMLAALAIYGGLNQTMSLLVGSPALDGASKNAGYYADENGVTRPLTGADIGAFQTLGFTMTVVAGTTPQSTAVDNAFGNPIAVRVTAKSPNDPVTGGVIVFTETDGTGGASGTFPNGQTTFSATIVDGMAAAPMLTANSTVGTFTVTATALGVTGSPITFTLNNTPAAASIKFVNVVMDHDVKTTATVGMAFGSPSPTVEVLDAKGKAVSGVTVVFTLPASGPDATAAGSLSVVTGATGLASAPALTANTMAGSWQLQASIGAIVATPQTMTNNPGPFTQLVYQSGAGQTSPVSTPFGAPLIAEAEDKYGNGVNGVAVTFVAPANPLTKPGPSATLSATTAKTTTTSVTVSSAVVNGQAGIAEVHATANSVLGGPYNVTASAPLPSGTKTTMSGGPFALTNGTVLSNPTIQELPDFGAYAPQGIASSDGYLWLSSEDDTIYRVTPAGVVAPFTNPMIQGESAITAGPDGNVWFIDFRGAIGKITPAGVVNEYTTNLPPGGQPDGDSMCAGPDGNVWFIERSGVTNGVGVQSDEIGKITPAGAITMYPAIAGVFPEAITSGPGGDLWFTEYINGTSGIAKITTAGVVTQVASGIADLYLEDIAEGSDGNLWFIEQGTGQVGRVTPAGMVNNFSLGNSGSVPIGITAGPDGNLWVTDQGANKIVRLTTAGVATPFTIGIAASSGLEGITAGPDDTIWFAAAGIGGAGFIAG